MQCKTRTLTTANLVLLIVCYFHLKNDIGSKPKWSVYDVTLWSQAYLLEGIFSTKGQKADRVKVVCRLHILDLINKDGFILHLMLCAAILTLIEFTIVIGMELPQ